MWIGTDIVGLRPAELMGGRAVEGGQLGAHCLPGVGVGGAEVETLHGQKAMGIQAAAADCLGRADASALLNRSERLSLGFKHWTFGSAVEFYKEAAFPVIQNVALMYTAAAGLLSRLTEKLLASLRGEPVVEPGLK